MFKYKCEICGNEFESVSNHAKYCVYCRGKAQAMRNRAYAEKKNAGLSVSIGSEQKCQVCGKPYTVTSGFQKYCSECQKKQQQASKGKPSAEYIKKNYDYIHFHLPKGEGDKVKEYAQERGLTVRQLLLEALKEYAKNHD